MKGKIMLCALLFLVMFFIPFLSVGAKVPDKTGTVSQKSQQQKTQSMQSGTEQKNVVPQAQTQAKSAFKILDTSSGKTITVDDRTFLYGAIVSEMSPTAPLEALKAQGVAAYTYYSRAREKKQATAPNEAHFTADTEKWQIYVTKEQMQERWGSNFDAYYSKLDTAVNAIYGQVLKSDGELIDATYYAISSGKTETSEDIWGGKRSYLVSVASPGDLFSGGYQTTAVLTADQFKAAVQKSVPKAKLGGDAKTWVGAIKRTGSGSVQTVVIGGETVSGNDARSIIGLRSANFTVSYSGGNFTFTVKGYGHGVGMSQVGAEYMANQGATYRQILAWYYPTTTLVNAS
jgi:stage II sporulation protein D